MSHPRSLADWESYIQTLHRREIELGLGRVREVQRRLDLERVPFTVVTVAGTNGKGSSIAMLEAILHAAGFRVGAYTSPHLVRYNERVRIDRRALDDATLCAAFEAVERARGGVPLTYFEFGTLAALAALRERSVEIASLEVGLGGRLDAVNAVDCDVALVTSVGIDHTQWLGGDRERIGREKAGIFRPARPAVCADPAPPASVGEAAAACGAPFFQLGRDFGYEHTAAGWLWWGPGGIRRRLAYPAMEGEVQLQNAAGVLMVLECLRDRFRVSPEAVRRGLRLGAAPARCQTLPGRPLRVFDVAHNVEAVEVLRRHLEQRPVAGPTVAVFGMLRDKPVAEVVRAVAPVIDAWHVTALEGPRGARADEVARALAQAAPGAACETHADPVSAYAAARRHAGADGRVVVFGSFYTVGAIMRAEADEEGLAS